ncbi:macrophage mannose receptor 1-like isoform X6, partial [Clarias magur]
SIMKLNLFLLCLTGTVPLTLSTAAHTYHLIMTPMTWSAAQNYCRETYDDLGAVESFNDWLRISAEALRHFMIFPGWIGLYNNVTGWRWSLNNVPLKDTALTKWASSEPSNDGDACGAIDYLGYWSANPCSLPKSFICYDSTFIGSARFIPYNFILLNWFGAQAFCRQFHTDLASATNILENNDIGNRVVFLFSSWFGLFRDTWTWTDGTIATNLPWGIFQPDYVFGNKECATFTVGMYYSGTCSDEYAFYCHSTPPLRQVQIIKLQVNSDVRVFNPALQSFILQQ